MSTVFPPEGGNVLREHRQRIRALEGNVAGIQEGGWHYVGAVGEPPFQSGWGNAGGKLQAAFHKIGTYVFLRGVITGGVDGTVAFTLPTGYRPTGEEPFVTDLDPIGFAKVRIELNGSVVVLQTVPITA